MLETAALIDGNTNTCGKIELNIIFCSVADFGPIKALFTSVTDPSRRACPLCDSSVYSYCGDKLFHDSCCCYMPKNPYGRSETIEKLFYGIFYSFRSVTSPVPV